MQSGETALAVPRPNFSARLGLKHVFFNKKGKNLQFNYTTDMDLFPSLPLHMPRTAQSFAFNCLQPKVTEVVK